MAAERVAGERSEGLTSGDNHQTTASEGGAGTTGVVKSVAHQKVTDSTGQKQNNNSKNNIGSFSNGSGTSVVHLQEK